MVLKFLFGIWYLLQLLVSDSSSFFINTCNTNCRYHYNVIDSRLHQHVEKGKEDGLYISCVASSLNLWAIVMDAGTGFTSQVYELSPIFLHKVELTGSQLSAFQFQSFLLLKPQELYSFLLII